VGEDPNIYQWVGIPIYTSGCGSQYIPVGGDPNIYQWVRIPIYTSGWGSQYKPVGEDFSAMIYQQVIFPQAPSFLQQSFDI
jgi:hypothetical protein